MTVRADPGGVPETDLPVRRLTTADLPAITELAADRDWPPEAGKWRLMFAVSEPFGVDDPAGGLAGVVVLTRYGGTLAAIGMMLVASRHGRKGLGRRLMLHALALAGDAVVYLTATDYGRPLYERLGFRAIDDSVTYRGRLHAGPQATGQPRAIGLADLPAIEAADAPVFGADRGRVLRELAASADLFVSFASPADGFGAAWAKDGTRVIGPVVAADLGAATRLITALAAGWTGPVRLDVLGRHPDLAAWALASGLTTGDRTALMVRGGALPGDRSRLYCPVAVAIG